MSLRDINRLDHRFIDDSTISLREKKKKWIKEDNRWRRIIAERNRGGDLTGFNDGENTRSASEPNYLNTHPRANLTVALLVPIDFQSFNEV